MQQKSNLCVTWIKCTWRQLPIIFKRRLPTVSQLPNFWSSMWSQSAYTYNRCRLSLWHIVRQCTERLLLLPSNTTRKNKQHVRHWAKGISIADSDFFFFPSYVIFGWEGLHFSLLLLYTVYYKPSYLTLSHRYYHYYRAYIIRRGFYQKKRSSPLITATQRLLFNIPTMSSPLNRKPDAEEGEIREDDATPLNTLTSSGSIKTAHSHHSHRPTKQVRHGGSPDRTDSRHYKKTRYDDHRHDRRNSRDRHSSHSRSNRDSKDDSKHSHHGSHPHRQGHQPLSSRHSSHHDKDRRRSSDRYMELEKPSSEQQHSR